MAQTQKVKQICWPITLFDPLRTASEESSISQSRILAQAFVEWDERRRAGTEIPATPDRVGS